MNKFLRNILLSLFFLNGLLLFSQEQALEVYMRKKPSKRYVIKIDDKVLVKCRHNEKGSSKKELLIARLGAIDGRKFYFYPMNTNYGETIYTPSTLRELGIRTTFNKILAISHYGGRIYNLIRFGKIDYWGTVDESFYKRVKVKSLKWRIRVIDI